MTRRKNKKLSEEEINEVENFVQTKRQENRVFPQIKVEVTPKTENQKKLVDS